MGKLVGREALLVHLRGQARSGGRHVAPVADHHRREEVRVQVVDIFEDPVIEARPHRDIVEEARMLDEFAEPDPPCMGTDGKAELLGQQQHRDHLVGAGQTRPVELDEAQAASLHELLEHHRVVAMLSGGHRDRRDLAGDAGVAEDVVGARRLLDPPGVERGERLHV